MYISKPHQLLPIIFAMACPSTSIADDVYEMPETIKIWTNAFIPGEGMALLLKDDETGFSYLTEPFQIVCFSTDNRFFSKEKDASSRVSQYLELEIIQEKPWIKKTTYNASTGNTKATLCGDYENVLCDDYADSSSIEEPRVNRKGVNLTVNFKASAGNPCLGLDVVEVETDFLNVDWDLNFEINIITREFSIKGTVQKFPGVETWIQYDNDDPRLLYACLPDEDSTPLDLIGDGQEIETDKLESKYLCDLG